METLRLMVYMYFKIVLFSSTEIDGSHDRSVFVEMLVIMAQRR